MKEIFDWLREKIERDVRIGRNSAFAIAEHINEAETKWESDCCEWKKYKDKRINYKNCKWRNEDIDEYSVEQFEFCPYCGKKIKVVK